MRGLLSDSDRFVLSRFQVADHDHHEIVKIVRDAAAELSDCLHLLGGQQLLLSFLELLLRFCRSVTSRVTFANPISSPASSRMASMTTEAKNFVPSFRTLHPSAPYRPSVAAVCNAFAGTPAARSSSVRTG